MKALIPILVDAFRFTPGGIRRTFRLWMETETHVFAFAIAANVLIAFYPFLLVMTSFCLHVLHWPAAVDAIKLAIRDFFAGTAGEDLVRYLSLAVTWDHRKWEWGSVLLLMLTANGVFLPLEVALNRAWGITKNRSFWKNQVVSTGLIFACGILVLLSNLISAANAQFFSLILGRWPGIVEMLALGVMKIVSLPLSVSALLLIYWILPNKQIHVRYLLPSAIRVGVTLELAKWLSIWVTPWFFAKFHRETVVFEHSLTIVAWSFLASMVVLAGAQSSAWRARTMEAREMEEARETAIPGAVVSEPSANG